MPYTADRYRYSVAGMFATNQQNNVHQEGLIWKFSKYLLNPHRIQSQAQSGCVEVQAVGAGAANQAIKAVAVARGYLAPSGIDLVCVPAFANVVIDGEERTAIKLIVEPR